MDSREAGYLTEGWTGFEKGKFNGGSGRGYGQTGTGVVTGGYGKVECRTGGGDKGNGRLMKCNVDYCFGGGRTGNWATYGGRISADEQL